MFFYHFFFKKGNNFRDLLFAALDNVDLLKWGLHVLSKERISHLVLTSCLLVHWPYGASAILLRDNLC